MIEQLGNHNVASLDEPNVLAAGTTRSKPYNLIDPRSGGLDDETCANASARLRVAVVDLRDQATVPPFEMPDLVAR